MYRDDFQTYGGIKMLRDLGKKIPEDIAIIGFDDMRTNSIIQPSLCSIKQPMYEMGKLGIQMLLKSINKCNYAHESKELNCELILCKSYLVNYKEEDWSNI